MSVDYLRMFLIELFVFRHLRSIALADAVPLFNGFHHQHDAFAATGAQLWVSPVEHLEGFHPFARFWRFYHRLNTKLLPYLCTMQVALLRDDKMP